MLRQAEEREGETPLQRLEAEHKRLTERYMRSELENEMLALELVNDRVKLKENLDQVSVFVSFEPMKVLYERIIQVEDEIEKLTRELQATRSIVKESEEHTFRLNEELENVREKRINRRMILDDLFI